MIHRVEERPQIAIDDVAFAPFVFAFLLQLLDSSVGTSARTKAIRILTEGWLVRRAGFPFASKLATVQP